MRKLVVANIMSLDGFYEGPGKDVMALPFDPAFDDYNAERLRAADTLLVGRTTFEQLKGYWPSVAEDPDAGPAEREVSQLLGSIEKVVISDGLTAAQTSPWDSTRIVKRAGAHAEVAALKQRRGGELLMVGSHVLWNDLLRAGLVDELRLMVGPAVLGAGTPAFDGGLRVPLELLEARRLENSALVLLRYGVRQAA